MLPSNSITYDACWYSTHDFVWFDVARNHATGGHYRVFANGDPGQDNATGPEPNMLFDCNGASCMCGHVLEVVPSCVKMNMRRYVAIWSDENAVATVKVRVELDASVDAASVADMHQPRKFDVDGAIEEDM